MGSRPVIRWVGLLIVGICLYLLHGGVGAVMGLGLFMVFA
jgi:hypothetical protein